MSIKEMSIKEYQDSFGMTEEQINNLIESTAIIIDKKDIEIAQLKQEIINKINDINKQGVYIVNIQEQMGIKNKEIKFLNEKIASLEKQLNNYKNSMPSYDRRTNARF